MKRILIAGCGYVGTALGLELVGQGHRVWGLRRDPTGLPAPLQPLAADLTDPRTLQHAPSRFDAVVYCASPDESSDAAYARVYLEGLRNLLASPLVGDASSPRVLLTSSTAVYGQRHGEWVDERSPTQPQRYNGRQLLEAERLLEQSGLPATIARLAGIYGPGRSRLLETVRAGRATYPATGPHYTNRIHRDDCAGALAHLLSLPAPEPTVVVADHDPAERQVVVQWLAERLGAPPPQPSEKAGVRGTSKRCSNARLCSSGYTLRYPTFREGYCEQLQCLQRAVSMSPVNRPR